jgi:hypothetical protein
MEVFGFSDERRGINETHFALWRGPIANLATSCGTGGKRGGVTGNQLSPSGLVCSQLASLRERRTCSLILSTFR